MQFNEAFQILVNPAHEGGYSNNPADPGGETMYGVTARVARAHGYAGEMRDLPLAKAQEIYKQSYWDTVRADELPDAVRFDAFDAAVNSGPAQSIKFLQQACGFTGQAVDGKLGPKTLAAIHAMDPQLFDKRNAGYRLLFMVDLKTWPTFARGWARRIGTNLIED